MRVLFASSEVAPYSKTGGLGDVSAALPAALAARGLDLRVVTPLHAGIDRAGLERTGIELSLRFTFGQLSGRLWSHRRSPQHEVLFVECAPMFDRPGIYGERAVDYP